jgi:hypothetical protein
MDGERPVVDSAHRVLTIAEKMHDERYRHAYVINHTRQFLAQQMRAFRGDMSQAQFGRLLGKPQSVVSRLEDPNYGKWTLQTLFDVAKAMDVGVFVRFVDFPTFLKYSDDFSESAQRPNQYTVATVDNFALNYATGGLGGAPLQPSSSDWTTLTISASGSYQPVVNTIQTAPKKLNATIKQFAA